MTPANVPVKPVEEQTWHIPPEMRPREDQLVIEDGKPVDNILSEKNMRLLTEPLHSNWSGPKEDNRFVAMANVGLFFADNQPPVVPDVMVSLDVALPTDMSERGNRTYFIWRYGKPPEVVIEIVSNNEGRELGEKLTIYDRIGISYYVVFDPEHFLTSQTLQIFFREAEGLMLRPQTWLPKMKLGLCLWNGIYEDFETTYLRWCDQSGTKLLPTGAEAAEEQRKQAEAEKRRANTEKRRADKEKRRADNAERKAEDAEREAAEALAELQQKQERMERMMQRLRENGLDVPNGE